MPIIDLELPDEPERPKPTKTQTSNPDPFGAFDLTGSKNLPSSPGSSGVRGGGAAGAPGGADLPRASGARTRAATSNIRPSDQMRDYLNRINFNDPDEIDDAEAARRAGLQGDERPELLPGNPVPLLPDRVQRQDLPAVLNRTLRAAGEEMPEWHTINNLPGYMARAIRAMGRQFFRMFTRTPLEDIMTIANVQGQGPNTDSEMRAVAAWLRDNAEDMGRVEVDMGPAIPGYEPEVREYRANGVRFHVVRDFAGVYIYAYPDTDAVSHEPRDQEPRLGNQVPRLGRNRNESMENSKTSALTEAIRASDLKLMLKEYKKDIDRQTRSLILEMMLSESTLSKVIGGSPGGQNVLKWLHNVHKLSNTAEVSEITPATGRVQLKQFKNNPDHFMVVVGRRAVMAMKPDEKYMARKMEEPRKKGAKPYNPSEDTSLLYQVIGFAKDERIDNLLIPLPNLDDFDGDRNQYELAVQAVEEKRRQVINFNAPATKMTFKRGGKPFAKDPYNNFFDTIKQAVGGINAVYIVSGRSSGPNRQPGGEKTDVKGFVKGYEPGEAPEKTIAGPQPTPPEGWKSYKTGGVERGKLMSRSVQRRPGKFADFNEELKKLMTKLAPLVPKFVNQAAGLAKLRAGKLMNNGDFDGAQRTITLAKKLADLSVKINSSNNSIPSMREFIRVFTDAVAEAARDTMVPGDHGEEKYVSMEPGEYLYAINRGDFRKLGEVISATKARLLTL